MRIAMSLADLDSARFPYRQVQRKADQRIPGSLSPIEIPSEL